MLFKLLAISINIDNKIAVDPFPNNTKNLGSLRSRGGYGGPFALGYLARMEDPFESLGLVGSKTKSTLLYCAT